LLRLEEFAFRLLALGDLDLQILTGLEQLRRALLDLPLKGHCPLAAQLRQLQMGSDACKEFASGERLNEVIVCARLESLNGRFLTRARRQQNNGNRAGTFISSQLTKQAKAIEHGHHHVREDELRGCGSCGGECLRPSLTVVTS